MMTLILYLMMLISPYSARDVAQGIDYAVTHDPLPAGWTKEYTVAVMVLTSYEESRWRMSAIGDKGKAVCAFQVWGPKHLANDPIGCARFALAVMREGAKICPDEPLAPYCGGCNNPAARAIARHRRLLEVPR